MSHNITVEGGTSVRLPTAGKYCDRDIVVTATGGGSGWDEEIPNDGKTRLFIHLGDGRKSPVLGCCPNGTVTVDWGDGTDPVMLTGTSVSSLKYTDPHEYAEPGDYVITLTVDGNAGLRGTTISCLLCASSTSSDIDFVYTASIKKIVVGNSISVIGAGAFQHCCALSSVAIPDGIKTFSSSAFRFCYALSCITIPGSISSIATLAFSDCSGVKYYDFSACSAIPTLVNMNAFNLIADDCEIRVPAAMYDEWIAATNWSSVADHIVAV